MEGVPVVLAQHILHFKPCVAALRIALAYGSVSFLFFLRSVERRAEGEEQLEDMEQHEPKE